MRTRNFVLCTLTPILCFFLLTFSGAQVQPSASQEKLQHIRQLITLLGGVDSLQRSMHDEIATLRAKSPHLNKEYWTSLVKESDEKDLQGLVDSLVSVYDRYLTDEEVSEMLRFYDSPVGKKVTSALPQISRESKGIILEWRQSLAKRVMDRQGELIRAVATGNTAKVKELLSKRSDVNERNPHGVTALMAAAYKGNMALARLLIEKGADLNAQSNKGSTPLMAAVESGNKHLVSFLLAKGANPDAKDERGLNAYQIAFIRGQQEMTRLLQEKTKDIRPVKVLGVIASVEKREKCLPVLSSDSDSSHKVACLRTGEKVELIGLPRDDGWTRTVKPAMGWVQTQFLKQTLVFRDTHKTVATKPEGRVTPDTLADVPASSEPSEDEIVTRHETPARLRIWWRR